MRIAALVLALFIASPPQAVGDKPWAWFVATSVIDQWNLEKGTAKVTLTKSTFRAELYIGDYLRHTLAGTRQGNKLKAKLTTLEADQIDYPVEGTYELRSWENFPTGGRESIVLYGGGLVIGLVREVNK
ncbi:MAG: hypothetical protein ACT4PZ_05995 [Panacagrimonas sp.]